MVRGILLVASTAPLVSGHGYVRSPWARNQDNATGEASSVGVNWFNQGCYPGCKSCIGGNFSFDKPECDGTPLEPAITNPEERTIFPETDSGSDDDLSKYNPWRNPGRAPVLDPCGLMGGWTSDNSVNGGFVVPPHVVGEKGSSLPPLPIQTEWVAGSVVEVEWAMAANHGGGYQWRLCPKGQESSEDCFASSPLDFASNSTFLSFLRTGDRVEIPAVRVTVGTFPENSEWRKNPIPTCWDNQGSGWGLPNPYMPLYNFCTRPMFQPPEGCDRSCWGYNMRKNMPSIIDQVKVPVTTGDFVLQWRWDCEHTAQVWTSCSDVTITSPTIQV